MNEDEDDQGPLFRKLSIGSGPSHSSNSDSESSSSFSSDNSSVFGIGSNPFDALKREISDLKFQIRILKRFKFKNVFDSQREIMRFFIDV